MAGDWTPEKIESILPQDWDVLSHVPTLADAWDVNGPAIAQNMRDAAAAVRDPQTWTDAARQYGQALVAGTSAPKGVRVWHGSTASFDKFDLGMSGTGATANGYFANPKELPPYIYTASEKDHASLYGEPREFQLNGAVKKHNAVPELKDWAKELGYKTPQEMVDKYFDGDAYQALGSDQYFIEKMRAAQKEGIPNISVDFGPIMTKVSDGRQIKMGKVYLSSDPGNLEKIVNTTTRPETIAAGLMAGGGAAAMAQPADAAPAQDAPALTDEWQPVAREPIDLAPVAAP